MSSLPITLFTTSLLGLLLIILSLLVVRLRLKHKIGMGQGDNAKLERAARMQGNFTEYVPIALLLIALLEISGANYWVICFAAGSIILGRVLHAIGLYRSAGSTSQRKYGMLLTFLSILSASVTGLVHSLI